LKDVIEFQFNAALKHKSFVSMH